MKATVSWLCALRVPVRTLTRRLSCLRPQDDKCYLRVCRRAWCVMKMKLLLFTFVFASVEQLDMCLRANKTLHDELLPDWKTLWQKANFSSPRRSTIRTSYSYYEPCYVNKTFIDLNL